MRAALNYAWRGAHRSRNEVWTPILGGVLIYVALLVVGSQVALPKLVADNIWLSAVALIPLCLLAAQSAIFLARLMYWPIHRRVEPHGGLPGAVRAKVGKRMWPLLLMVSGVLAFVLLFGVGAIWAIAAVPETSARSGSPQAQVFVPYEIERRLQIIDRTRDLFTVTLRGLHHEGVDLHTAINSALQQGKPPDPATPDTLTVYSNKVEAALNELQATEMRYREYGYFREVVNFTPTTNQYEVVASARRLAKNLRDIPQGAGGPFFTSLISNQNFDSFGRATHDMATWINKSDDALGESRKSVLALPVAQSK